jgi:uncharacterized cupin superfamily protein
MQQQLVSQVSAQDLLALDAGAFAPKPTSTTEGQLERSLEIWSGGPGKLEVGLWDCTPGRFTATRDGYTELCYFLSGHVTVEDADGRRDYRAGDLLVMPEGWTGTWDVHEQVRKVYVIGQSG